MELVMFKWVFKNKPDCFMYFYEKSLKDCHKRIQRTYRITENDYEILGRVKGERICI